MLWYEHFAYNTSLVHNYMHVRTIIYMYVYVHTHTHASTHVHTHMQAHTHKTYTYLLFSLPNMDHMTWKETRSARVPPVFTTMINLSSDKPTQTVFVHRASLRCYPPKGLQNFHRGTRLVHVCPLVPIRYQASFGWHAESNLVTVINVI